MKYCSFTKNPNVAEGITNLNKKNARFSFLKKIIDKKWKI